MRAKQQSWNTSLTHPFLVLSANTRKTKSCRRGYGNTLGNKVHHIQRRGRNHSHHRGRCTCSTLASCYHFPTSRFRHSSGTSKGTSIVPFQYSANWRSLHLAFNKCMVRDNGKNTGSSQRCRCRRARDASAARSTPNMNAIWIPALQ